MQGNKKTTVENEEVKKFDELAEYWWDPNGKFKLLHEINPLRINYIKTQVCQALKLDGKIVTPFKGLKLLDIGCGGGLISIPMHRLGADVMGIDASHNNIKIAQEYSLKRNLDVQFSKQTVEELADKDDVKFDIVLALEIIEHVADYKLFLEKAAKLVNKHGILIITTINKTFKSLALAKIGAEYILRILPAGTHDWHKFLKPSEIEQTLANYNLKCIDLSGMTFKPFGLYWQISNDVSINYLMTFGRN